MRNTIEILLEEFGNVLRDRYFGEVIDVILQEKIKDDVTYHLIEYLEPDTYLTVDNATTNPEDGVTLHISIKNDTYDENLKMIVR